MKPGDFGAKIPKTLDIQNAYWADILTPNIYPKHQTSGGIHLDVLGKMIETTSASTTTTPLVNVI